MRTPVALPARTWLDTLAEVALDGWSLARGVAGLAAFLGAVGAPLILFWSCKP